MLFLKSLKVRQDVNKLEKKLTETRPYPLRDDCNKRVSFESLYGMCMDLPSVSLDITCKEKMLQSECPNTRVEDTRYHKRWQQYPHFVSMNFTHFSQYE